MVLPASGNSISLDQIHVELGQSSGTTVSLGDDDVNFVRRTYIKPYANTEMEKEKSDWLNNQFKD